MSWQHIVATTYSPSYGARPLRRYFTNTLGTSLSKLLISREVAPSSNVTITVKEADDGTSALHFAVLKPQDQAVCGDNGHCASED